MHIVLFSKRWAQYCLTCACVVLLGACGDKVETANTKTLIQDTAVMKLPLEGYQVIPFNIAKEDVTLEIFLKVYNASNVEAKITEIFLDVMMNGTKVGSINESSEFTIMPTQTTEVSYKFSFNPSLVIKNIVNILTLTVALKDVVIVADGYMKVKSGLLSTTVPFTYQNTLKNLLKK
jgi:LEA14-like dessication related protein